MGRAGYRIGIDVGGTFTDVVLVHDGRLTIEKHPTTPRDQSEGVLGGIGRLADRLGLSVGALLARTETIVHGTTTADNTMIEMSGAVTGLITSEGHRDEIEIRRGYKEDIWDPALPPPKSICPRRQRYGVPERLDFEGNVVVPLDEDAVRRALRRMRLQGVESLAVVFLFSFVNPRHERRVREIAAEELPGVMVSLSHEVMPAAPEFERTSTTLVNAYVGPRIERYLSRLAGRLRDAGFAGELLIMQSNGGVMPGGYVAQKAVAVMGSGPAGGAMGAATVAGAAGIRDFISVDMGGTSYDVSLVRNGTPEVKAGWNWHHRYLIGLPMVDVQTVGAGGGSIARVEAGALKVGPQSAGAEPGPVCYGRGGVEPTVTDANVVLGFLNPTRFCAGTMTLDAAAAAAAIRERIAKPLGLSLTEAADGIFRIVNANMANAIRRASAQKGIDPRPLALVVFGGNGPVHAGMQAAELGIRQILVPKLSPAFSALGLLLTDHVVDEMRSYVTPIAGADLARINALFADMDAAARAALGERRSRRLRIERRLALCYPGQTFDMPVPVAGTGPLTSQTLAATVERFHRLHEELHTYASRDQEPILRGLALKAIAREPKPALPRPRRSRKPPVRVGKRAAFFRGRFVATPIYEGPELAPGHEIAGPAIIEEPFTTIVVYPGQRARVDRFGNYAIDVAPRQRSPRWR
ncbi:MAG TPA: hydantoinase/oxoprolinase family protein [Candidatus Limnocylindria bacterium]|nr:hydantoinase/oxoprolinase family protein [Candidatus Limnocylindria bacterium]